MERLLGSRLLELFNFILANSRIANRLVRVRCTASFGYFAFTLLLLPCGP